MSSLAKVTIIGNLGRDPEMRYTPAGKPVTSFSVAINSHSGTGEERKEDTEWFRVSAWGKLAETCSTYLHKGSKVFIEGRLHTRSWEGQDGKQHFELEVIAEQLVLLGGKATPPDDDVPI